MGAKQIECVLRKLDGLYCKWQQTLNCDLSQSARASILGMNHTGSRISR